MTIQLANDVEELLRERADVNAPSSLNELANDLLRSLCELQRQPFAGSKEIEEWLLLAADEATTPLRKSDFDAIREKLRAGAKR